MKNLRKVLALVLVVASIMSFALVSNAAQVDFADDATITKAEAVDLLSALGVINGIKQADGTFDFMPEGNVKRGEMAKMIAYILNGGTDIGDLYKDACTYADAKDHWAAGYIAYCDAQDIINGYTDGSYKPNADVTVLEAAKMILCALGYEAEVCGLTGEKWASNVITLAHEKNIFSNIDQNATEKATRETAAQMLLNALTEKEVTTKAPQSVTVNGVIITTGNVEITEKSTALYEHFEGLAKTTAVRRGDFRIPGYEWTLNGSRLSFTPWKLVKTFTNVAPYADMRAALGNVKLNKGGNYVTVDGAISGSDGTYGNAEFYANINEDYTVKSKFTNMSSVSQGRTADLYYDADTKIANLIIKNTYIGKIALNSKGEYTVKNLDGTDVAVTVAGTSYTETAFYANDEGFAKDDIVTFNFSVDKTTRAGVYNVELATSAVLELTNIQKDTAGNLVNFRLGTTYYKFNAAKATADAKALVKADNLGKTFTVYFDKVGNVLHMVAPTGDTPAAPTTGYAIVENAATENVANDIWGEGGSTNYLARLRGVDGNLTQVSVKADAKSLIGAVVKFTVGTDGKYTLEKIADPAAASVSGGNIITNKNAIMALDVNVIANTKTTFVVETVKSGKSTWTVYAGIEAVPTIVSGNVVALDKDGAVAADNKLAAIVFVKNAVIYSAPAASTELNLSMIRLWGGETSSYVDKVEVFSNIKAMINGEATVLTLSRAAHSKLTNRNSVGINYITSYKVENGIVTDVTVATAGTDYVALEITEAYKDGLMVLDGTSTYVAKGSIPAYVYQYNYGVFAEMSLDELPGSGKPNGEAQPNQYVAVKNASGAIVAVFGFATV